MSRIQNDGLKPAYVRNAMGTHERLDCFRHISARDQIFSVLLHHREAQPTARAVDHCLSAAAHKFQRIFDGLETDFIACTSDAGGQSIKLRNVVNGQIIVPAYFNDLPIAGSKSSLRESEGSADKHQGQPTLHQEEHACGIVSKIQSISMRCSAVPASPLRQGEED